MKPCLTELTISEVAHMLRDGQISAEALVQAHLNTIAAQNPAIGAFVYVAEKAALEAARLAGTEMRNGIDRGPLHGIPFAIKDIFDVKGWPICWGSRSCADRIATRTAPAVQTLLDAGAIPLGVVATYELATVGPDQSSLYPQPRNPMSEKHITGGSSSGSAAAVASGMVRIALGTDTGGSVRSPSAYCGVVGLKPTFGEISTEGVMELATSLDHVGIIARTVPEAAAMFGVLPATGGAKTKDATKIRIGYARSWADDAAAHPDLLGLLDEAASVLSLQGMEIALIDLPDYDAIESAAIAVILAEGYAHHAEAVTAAPDLFGDMARQSILSGANISAERIAEARAVSQSLRTALDTLFAQYDVLILPTVLSPAPEFSAFTDGRPMWTAMRTIPFNMTGHPAISVPMGQTDGLPLGLQIVGRHGAEDTILSVAARFEAATAHGIDGTSLFVRDHAIFEA